jgi:hypothetical protein
MNIKIKDKEKELYLKWKKTFYHNLYQKIKHHIIYFINKKYRNTCNTICIMLNNQQLCCEQIEHDMLIYGNSFIDKDKMIESLFNIIDKPSIRNIILDPNEVFTLTPLKHDK